MLDKILAWCGNVLLASVLVLLASQQLVFAQSSGAASGGDQQGKIIVPLSGGATVKRVSDLQVAPASFDTGMIEIGDSKIQTVKLTHIGSTNAQPIEITDATLFGKNASEYATDFNGFVTLYPGDEVTLDVIFTPSSPGVKSAGLRMTVEGATAPYVLLFNGTSRYPLTSDLSTSDQKVLFGQIVEGATSQKKFILTNQGEAQAPSITVSAIQLSGDTPGAYTVVFNPITLIPGQSVDITVKLSSPAKGFKSAAVEVIHDGNNPSIEMTFEGNVVTPGSVPVNFGKSTLKNVSVVRPTAVEFGPDGKLYVAEMSGLIHVFAVTRNAKNNYTANKTETITLIKNVPNHNDDGTPNNGLNDRLLTGIQLAGTAATPIIYAASNDPRQAAGPSGHDSNLDTNSGILHKLTKTGGGWVKQDVVRGLPRSEENHVANGVAMYGNKILVNTGGHTNMGAPANNFALLPEYALSGAILEVDLGAIGTGTYDLPTLDDEDRAGTHDANDPFGGNNGKNQAKLVQGGPVKLFATGFRNIYDITVTQSGKVYTFDNGPNPGWGGKPVGNCTNNRDDTGARHNDGLHLVTAGYYGGHPNPTRGNKSNTFNASNPQTPIEGPARPQECNYKVPGNGDGSLTTIVHSTNGIDEYTASNFLGAMQGNLLAASFDTSVYRIQLNAAGNQVTSKSKLLTGLGDSLLDVTSQGDADVFPGTIWTVDNFKTTVLVFEPSDFQ